MRRLASLVLLLCHALVFLNVNTALAFGPDAKVKVTHSHEHGSDHHHHGGTDGKSKRKKPASIPHNGNQHSHEISAVGQAVVASGDAPLILVEMEVLTVRLNQRDEIIPKSPALLGIFRPPIA